MAKAAILRGKPGIQIAVEKKASKGDLVVSLGGSQLWSAPQKSLLKADLGPLEQAVRAATTAGGGALSSGVASGASDAAAPQPKKAGGGGGKNPKKKR